MILRRKANEDQTTYFIVFNGFSLTSGSVCEGWWTYVFGTLIDGFLPYHYLTKYADIAKGESNLSFVESGELFDISKYTERFNDIYGVTREENITHIG